MSISVLMGQILVLFLEIIVGYVAAKAHVLNESASKVISRLIMTITLPCSMLAGANIDDSEPGMLAHLLQGLVLLLSLFVITAALTTLLARALKMSPGKRAVLVTMAVLPNCAFMGIPLASALIGSSQGLLYGAAGIVSYNVLFFTYMTSLFRPGTKLNIKDFMTPANFGTVAMITLLVLGWHFSGPPQQFLSAVGNCTTPLALIVVGIMLAKSDLRALVTTPFLYLITLLRCVVIPLAFLAVLHIGGFDDKMAMGIFILAACPSGSLGAVMAEQCDMEPELASQSVAQSTLFSAATLPVLLMLASKLFMA